MILRFKQVFLWLKPQTAYSWDANLGCLRLKLSIPETRSRYFWDSKQVPQGLKQGLVWDSNQVFPRLKLRHRHVFLGTKLYNSETQTMRQGISETQTRDTWGSNHIILRLKKGISETPSRYLWDSNQEGLRLNQVFLRPVMIARTYINCWAVTCVPTLLISVNCHPMQHHDPFQFVFFSLFILSTLTSPPLWFQVSQPTLPACCCFSLGNKN